MVCQQPETRERNPVALFLVEIRYNFAPVTTADNLVTNRSGFEKITCMIVCMLLTSEEKNEYTNEPSKPTTSLFHSG